MTYHVLPVGVTVAVIWLFTLYLSSSGFTPRHSHRRFWNWILLVTFLMSGIPGIFLALRITYRWYVPFADQIKQWHVEAGSAMVFASLIHLTWHLGYYFRLRLRHAKGKADRTDDWDDSITLAEAFNGAGGNATENEKADGSVAEADVAMAAAINPLRFRIMLLLTGFVSSASQFILMREAAILGGGTEAAAGLFLWLWLIIAAGGAVAGGRSSITSPARMLWTLLFATLLAPLLLLMMTMIILNPGQTPTFLQILVILAVSVAPVTFISALIFVRISVIRHISGLSCPGNSFAAETAGSVTAGIVTALTVTLALPNYQLYLLILITASAIAAWLTFHSTHTRIAAATLLLPLAALFFAFPPDPAVRSLLLRGVKVTESRDTPYGNIATGYYGGEKTIYYDHRPVFFSGDVAATEENIHYALLQRERYERILLISGGLKRHLTEVAKYNVAVLDYLEIDPGLIDAEGARDTLHGKMTVRVIRRDPMTFLRESEETYDAVIQLIPPPATLSVNRYYTEEYFRLLREHISPAGIFMCTPMAWFNYAPGSYRQGYSPFHNSISAVFSHVTMIPGSLLYVIASDARVSPEPARLSGERGIETSYVNRDYLDDEAIRTKMEQILSQVDTEAGMNTASRPVSSLFVNILSLERMGMGGGMIAALAVLMFIPFAFIARRGIVMFASSASLAGFGMIMIFILQMAVGNIYILSAVILTLLMAGLAAGAAFGHRLGLKKIMTCTLLLAAISTAAGLLAPVLATSAPAPVLTVLGITLPAAGFITGAIYRILTAGDGVTTTGRIYGADLAGSALGYLTVATLVVPLAGTANACFILAGVILTSGTLASLTGNQ